VLSKRATNILLPVLDLDLETLHGIRRLDHEGDGLTTDCLQEDRHASDGQTNDQVKSRTFLDVVGGQGALVFELLAPMD